MITSIKNYAEARSLDISNLLSLGHYESENERQAHKLDNYHFILVRRKKRAA